MHVRKRPQDTVRGTKTREIKEMAQSNALLANLFSDIAGILFLNKHGDKSYSWWKPESEVSADVQISPTPPNAPPAFENMA